MPKTAPKPKKTKKEKAPAEQPPQPPVTAPEPPKKKDLKDDILREKPVPSLKERIIESRKVLNAPPPPGMAYFEAPDGLVMVGEAKNHRIWCRSANEGKGMWINKMRGYREAK